MGKTCIVGCHYQGSVQRHSEAPDSSAHLWHQLTAAGVGCQIPHSDVAVLIPCKQRGKVRTLFQNHSRWILTCDTDGSQYVILCQSWLVRNKSVQLKSQFLYNCLLSLQSSIDSRRIPQENRFPETSNLIMKHLKIVDVGYDACQSGNSCSSCSQ